MSGPKDKKGDFEDDYDPKGDVDAEKAAEYEKNQGAGKKKAYDDSDDAKDEADDGSSKKGKGDW